MKNPITDSINKNDLIGLFSKPGDNAPSGYTPVTGLIQDIPDPVDLEPITKAIKELQKAVESLQEENTDLKKRVSDLEEKKSSSNKRG